MTPAKPEAVNLKARLKDSGETWPETFRVRLHRAISWLARAEGEPDDHDAQFVFLWIAFNAAYARESSATTSLSAIACGSSSHCCCRSMPRSDCTRCCTSTSPARSARCSTTKVRVRAVLARAA